MHELHAQGLIGIPPFLLDVDGHVERLHLLERAAIGQQLWTAGDDDRLSRPQRNVLQQIAQDDGVHVTGPNTQAAGLNLGVVQGPGIIRYDIHRLALLPGRYNLTTAVHDSVDPIAYDYHEEAYSFRIVDNGARQAEGFVLLDADWHWLPGAAQSPALFKEFDTQAVRMVAEK